MGAYFAYINPIRIQNASQSHVPPHKKNESHRQTLFDIKKSHWCMQLIAPV
jgi:hypothetical protein